MELNDVLMAAEDRLRLVVLHVDALSTERDELMTFMRVYDRLTRPQPSLAAQTGQTEPPAPPAQGAVECAEPELPGGAPSGLAAPDTHSPEGASDAGRFDSGSLAEIVVKSQVQVLPVVEIDDKGGPTGMGRSDSGESTAIAEETGLASSSAPVRLMDRIRSAYAEHPDWTAGQFVAAIPGSKYNSVSRMLTLVRKETAAASSVRSRARADLLGHNHDHPEHTIAEVAAFLGLMPRSVAIMSRELGVRWSKKQEPADETSPVASVEVTGEVLATAPPQPTNVVAFEPARFGSPDVVHKPMQRAPRGKKFRLTDGNGNYLRYDCRAMVQGTKNTWEGTEAQLVACRRTFPLAGDLHEKPVEKVVRDAY